VRKNVIGPQAGERAGGRVPDRRAGLPFFKNRNI